MSLPVVVGITGASGAGFARRLVATLLEMEQDVALSVSPAGAAVVAHELKLPVEADRLDPASLWPESNRQRLACYSHLDLMAPIASGSYRTKGMVICPCSGGTLSAVAHGADQNLIQRAANVHLKERRPLILVPRETPLSLPMIENMRAVTLAGGVILPAAPGWYHAPEVLSDLVDFIVARILDQLGIEHAIGRRWGEGTKATEGNEGRVPEC